MTERKEETADHKRFTEGIERKGGLNTGPTTPRPDITPTPQKPANYEPAPQKPTGSTGNTPTKE